MEIGRYLGEMRVRFTNEVQISESEVHHFSGTRLDNNPTREVAAAQMDQPIPDFFGRAAEETFLTRATLWRIFEGVSKAQKATLHAHPEGWANTFVRVVGDVVKDHIVDRLRFREAEPPTTPSLELAHHSRCYEVTFAHGRTLHSMSYSHPIPGRTSTQADAMTPFTTFDPQWKSPADCPLGT